MRVVWAWSHSWEHHRSSLLVAFPSNEPAWENNGTEVGEEQKPSLLSRLDLERVKMHVELRCEIRVQGRVDVLKVVPAGVFVESIRLGVGFMEAPSSGTGRG